MTIPPWMLLLVPLAYSGAWPAPAEEAVFFRAVTLNGPALTIDEHSREPARVVLFHFKRHPLE